MRTLRSHRSSACLAAVLAAVALAVAAPIAPAQTTEGGYVPPSSNVQAEIQDTPTSPRSQPSAAQNGSTAANTVQRSGSQPGGALPFTGLDLGFIGLAGVGLLAAGFGLRRLTLREDRAEPRNAG
jgi:hypothetical protein